MKKAVLTILILVVALTIINIIPGLAKGLGNFVYKIFSPIEKLFANIGKDIIGFFQILTSVGSLNTENIALREKNTTLESELAQLQEVQKENDILKQALNISKSEHLTLDTAIVVGKDIQGLQDWILINKGSAHGLKENMTIISPEKALVGRIISVSDSFSKVMLISSRESIVSALIENTRSEGLVKKDEKGGIFMDFIPKTEQLNFRSENERFETKERERHKIRRKIFAAESFKKKGFFVVENGFRAGSWKMVKVTFELFYPRVLNFLESYHFKREAF